MSRQTSLSILAALLCAPLAFAAPAIAAKYYVSPTGSDDNPGTLAAPFCTIQHAADIMVAGDTCYIEAGVYRETVTPANSGTQSAPITFLRYGKDDVTVSGADPIGNWQRAGGHIYSASLTWDLGQGNNQVFVDGKMVTEARWPNTGSDLLRPTLAVAGAGTTPTQIDDPNLSEPAGYWAGATVWVLGGNQPYEPWVAQTGTVTSSSPGQIQFNALPLTGSDYDPCPGSFYYLTAGPASTLDSPGEWRLAGGSLWLWLRNSENPARHLVEAKRRDLAFDLSNKSYVDIQGIRVFAATISMANAAHCTVKGCHLEYLSHFTDIDSGWDTRDDTGVVISGSGNTLENSVVEYSAGNGVTLLGTGNTVTDCVIRDTDYAGTDSAGIRVTGSNQTVSDNTVFETGRTAILNRYLEASKIVNNDVSYFCMFTKDGGGTYCYQTDGQGTVIAYNRFHDALDSLFTVHLNVSGPYLDNGTSNTVVDHNVVWNVAEGSRLNPPSNNNIEVDNTFENTSIGQSVAGYGGDYTGDQFVNDIFAGPVFAGSGAVFSNDMNSGTDPLFIDPADGDFELQPGSPAIDSGEVFAPYTDGFVGSAPDIGAYEHGSTAWVAGASFAPSQPVGVAATPGSGSIALSWDGAANAIYYKVWEREAAIGAYTLIGSGIRATHDTVSGLVAGRTYQFAISAVNDRVEGPLSAPIAAEPN